MKTAFCLILLWHLLTGTRYRAREYLEEEPIRLCYIVTL